MKKFWNKPWFAGVYIWQYDNKDIKKIINNKAHDFSFQHKAAYKVIKDRYGKKD